MHNYHGRKNRIGNRRNTHSRIFGATVVLLLLLTACFPSVQTAIPAHPLSSTPDDGLGYAGPEVYFTDPSAIHASDYEGGPDGVLNSAIDAARLSVDVSAYSLNLWSIRDALIDAHKRGVMVHMVMETDNMDTPEVQEIMDAGIPVIGDQQQGLMHNKFLVIDHMDVWTGSMNYTTSGVYKDNNNLIHIRSSAVAEDYTDEFHQMFAFKLFGPKKSAGTPHPKVSIAGMPVEIYFSPEDKPAGRILELVQAAQKSIFFLAYSFTSSEIRSAMLAPAQAGVEVAGIMDDGQVKTSAVTEYDAFRQANLDVRLDGNLNGLMHHKVIIIDQQIVIAGSYNFTGAAETTNDENVLIIFSSDVAAKYMQEYLRVYNQAQLP